MHVLGWQEFVGLPALGMERVLTKLDSGAAHSVLHVLDAEVRKRAGKEWVRFSVDAGNGRECKACTLEAPLHSIKRIQSSSGHITVRPTIETTLVLAGYQWTIALSLTDRSSLQFPLLLGRSALSGRCLIDSSRTHLASGWNAYRASR
jgi:hypothetical protein